MKDFDTFAQSLSDDDLQKHLNILYRIKRERIVLGVKAGKFPVPSEAEVGLLQTGLRAHASMSYARRTKLDWTTVHCVMNSIPTEKT